MHFLLALSLSNIYREDTVEEQVTAGPFYFILFFLLKKKSHDWQNFQIAFLLRLIVSPHSNNVMQYIFAPKNMWCIRRRENGFPVLVAN